MLRREHVDKARARAGPLSQPQDRTPTTRKLSASAPRTRSRGRGSSARRSPHRLSICASAIWAFGTRWARSAFRACCRSRSASTGDYQFHDTALVARGGAMRAMRWRSMSGARAFTADAVDQSSTRSTRTGRRRAWRNNGFPAITAASAAGQSRRLVQLCADVGAGRRRASRLVAAARNRARDFRTAWPRSIRSSAHRQQQASR